MLEINTIINRTEVLVLDSDSLVVNFGNYVGHQSAGNFTGGATFPNQLDVNKLVNPSG
jgi:hypothetical protein